MRRATHLLTPATLVYGGVVLLAWLTIRLLGDRVAVAGPILFGPRWFLLVPALLLGPVALALRRSGALAGVLGIALFVLGPVMDFRASLGEDSSGGLRIMTHNLGRDAPTSARLMAILARTRPDVVVLQECIPDEVPIVADGYFTDYQDQLCLLSRFPIAGIDVRDRKDVWDRGGSGAIVLYTLRTPNGPLQILNVHLETVREGIQALRHGDFAEAKENVSERAWESELARAWADRATAPLLVGGDFNMPVESAIYRRYWSHLRNAFSEAGFGWGWTKRTRLFGVRIDHVLTSQELACSRAWIEGETGSDHRPLMADCQLVRPPPSVDGRGRARGLASWGD
jgi:endonuclease/exonuclease/phosphatase (EEP) superfamily protein YafD